MRRKTGQWVTAATLAAAIGRVPPYGQAISYPGGSSGPPTPVPEFTSVDKPITRAQGSILLTIEGMNFTDVSDVSISGTACTDLVVVSDTVIECVSPFKAPGTYDIEITGPGGTGTGASAIKYVNPTSIFGANLKRWYDAQYLDGEWIDESGNFDTSQANPDAWPAISSFPATVDRPTAEFTTDWDGIDDALNMGDAADIVTTAATMAFIAASAVTQNAEANTLSKNYGAESYIFGIRSANPNRMSWGGGGSTLAELSTSDAAVTNERVTRFIGTNNGTTSILYVDGVEQAHQGTGAITEMTADVNALGAAMATEAITDYHYKGKFAQVIIADVVADATQEEELDAYLRDCAGQPVSSFSPDSLSPLASYLPGYYKVADGEWEASIGTNATDLLTAPTETAGCPVFVNGVSSPLGAAVAFNAWCGAGDHTLFAAANVGAITSTSGTPYVNQNLIGDSSQYIGIYLKDAGAGVFQAIYYEYDSTTRVAVFDISAFVDGSGAGNVRVIARKTGGNLQISVNGQAFVTGDACGNTGSGGAVRIGGTPTVPDATIYSAQSWDRALTDDECAALDAWAATVAPP